MIRIALSAAALALLGLAGTAQAAGSAAAGQEDAGPCAMCHGPTGGGTQVAPKIAGMTPAAFVGALEEYRSGKKDNAMMKAQAEKLNPQQEQDLAAYYASLK